MTLGPFLPAGHTIRLLRQEDLSIVHAIECCSQEHPWSLAHFEAEYKNPVSTIDLYLVDREIAGFICTWLVAGEMQIQNLATAVAYRRCGIAAHLLEHVLARSRNKGLQSTWLEVRVSNLPAIALYRRYGFEQHARRANYYHDGEDALVMYLPEQASE